MSTIRTFARSHPLLVTAVGLAIGLAVIWFVPSDGSLANMMFIRLGLTIVMFAIMAVAAGCNIIVPNAKSIGLSFKKSIYPLVVALVMGVFVLLGTAMKNEGMVSDWPLQLALVIMLCLLVGTFEEGLFRGIVFSGLLARFGETRRGLIGAVIVSSLIFGFVHVTPSIMNGQVVTGLDMAQAALKSPASRHPGRVSGRPVPETRNIWASRWFMASTTFRDAGRRAFLPAPRSTTYVNNDAMMASASVVMYGVFFLLYIPIIVSTVRMLKQVEVPCKGPFADRWS